MVWLVGVLTTSVQVPPANLTLCVLCAYHRAAGSSGVRENCNGEDASRNGVGVTCCSSLRTVPSHLLRGGCVV